MAEIPSDDGLGAALPVPPKRRKRFLPFEEVLSPQADPGLTAELKDLLGEETPDDLDDPWERAARRRRQDQNS
ncbi:hypothetical protein [Amycolatopsis suaedae]|uniref:Uncharacterized protein n=1 Tax=Amycolatopsis suaedae TaxID=2510978 RepID=A0A4Q7IZ48_9PSEU|nr:hypothetical protein [Amycolatopsis suaedae]RZQ59343.1 hypothetical protein EWH70_34750 [Amycolatopsis suaedae]